MSTYDERLGSLVDVKVPVFVHSAGPMLPDIVSATQLIIDQHLKKLGVPTNPGWDLSLHPLPVPKGYSTDNITFSQLQQLLDMSGEYWDAESASLVQLVPTNGVEESRVSPYAREILVSYSEQSLAAGDLPELLAVELINIFGDEIDQYVDLVRRREPPGQGLAAAHSTNYHITFSLFVEGGEDVAWDIAPALASYFAPLERELSARVANFSIDTQVQFYSTLTSPPKQVIDSNITHYFFTQDDLSTFVNFADWSLSSIYSYPSINFILYVPSANHSPLLVENSPSNSFIIPQWGGVVIYNSKSLPVRLSTEDLEPILEIFTAQLFSLLGAPHNPVSSPLFRIDILSRAFALRSLFSAASSLGSLTRLSQSLPEIAIPKSVQTNVVNAVTSIVLTLVSLNSQRFWPSAVHSAAAAMQAAHNAFFEKMMVQQMYFPQEHKIAVYMPLLGPILIVMTMGLLRVVKEYKSTGKEEESIPEEDSKEDTPIAYTSGSTPYSTK